MKDKSADASISVYETAWGLKPSQRDPASTKSTELRIVEYGAKGDLADPRDVLRGHGLDLDTFAVEKSDVDQRVFEISTLDTKGGGEAKMRHFPLAQPQRKQLLFHWGDSREAEMRHFP